MREDHRECDVHIHEFRHAVNTAQSSTKFSPAFSNLARFYHTVFTPFHSPLPFLDYTKCLLAYFRRNAKLLVAYWFFRLGANFMLD